MTSWHADLGPRDDAVEKGRQCMLLQQLATSTPSRDALDGLQVASVRGAKLHTEERPGVEWGLKDMQVWSRVAVQCKQTLDRYTGSRASIW